MVSGYTASGHEDTKTRNLIFRAFVISWRLNESAASLSGERRSWRRDRSLAHTCDRRGVEPMVREHFGVAAARGHVGEADRAHLGADAGARERRRDHHALPQHDVMVV